MTEVYGPESSGKTTLCQHIVAEAQRRGEVGAYVDMDHALDPAYGGEVRGGGSLLGDNPALMAQLAGIVAEFRSQVEATWVSRGSSSWQRGWLAVRQ